MHACVHACVYVCVVMIYNIICLTVFKNNMVCDVVLEDICNVVMIEKLCCCQPEMRLVDRRQ